MRKVMIVDDEKWIRRGLIQSIDWARCGLELAGEANDGQEAYDMALILKPDLLFLDMRMPGLDGKQLLGMLNRDLPQTLTVVVSGYSDFEYMKEAIQHKAFDYLLKPVKKDELDCMLEKALAELERRQLDLANPLHSSREDWLSLHLMKGGEEGEPSPRVNEGQILPAGWKSGQYVVIVGRPDVYREHEDTAWLRKLFLGQLERNRPFFFEGRWEMEVVLAPGEPREIVVVLCGPQFERQGLLQLHYTMQAALRQAGGISVSFGISRVKHDPGQLAEGHREARHALRGKALSMTGAALFPWSEATPPAQAFRYPQEKENALLLALQAGSREAAEREFECWLAICAADRTTVEQLQQNAVLLVLAIGKQLQSRGMMLEEICGKKTAVYTDMILQRNDAASIRRLFVEQLLPAVLLFYGRSSEKQGEIIVSELKKLIEEQYDSALSLHQIAGNHYMNPDYVSRLFKKVTGKNFIDYLTDVRISKAKELLRMSKHKNYEIARMVGYEDYRYFSQIFKKKLGMTIGEYRNHIIAVSNEEENSTWSNI